MIERIADFSDYIILFGVICLIPTGLDGELITPIWVSLSIIGAGLLGKFIPALLNMLK